MVVGRTLIRDNHRSFAAPRDRSGALERAPSEGGRVHGCARPVATQ